MKTRFNRTIAKEIAEKSFCHVLDCILGYSDTGYDLSYSSEEFEQNFEEDLEEKDITVTNKRIQIINEYYEKMRSKFITQTRKQYYNEKQN